MPRGFALVARVDLRVSARDPESADPTLVALGAPAFEVAADRAAPGLDARRRIGSPLHGLCATEFALHTRGSQWDMLVDELCCGITRSSAAGAPLTRRPAGCRSRYSQGAQPQCCQRRPVAAIRYAGDVVGKASEHWPRTATDVGRPRAEPRRTLLCNTNDWIDSSTDPRACSRRPRFSKPQLRAGGLRSLHCNGRQFFIAISTSNPKVIGVHSPHNASASVLRKRLFPDQRQTDALDHIRAPLARVSTSTAGPGLNFLSLKEGAWTSSCAVQEVGSRGRMRVKEDAPRSGAWSTA